MCQKIENNMTFQPKLSQHSTTNNKMSTYLPPDVLAKIASKAATWDDAEAVACVSKAVYALRGGIAATRLIELHEDDLATALKLAIANLPLWREEHVYIGMLRRIHAEIIHRGGDVHAATPGEEDIMMTPMAHAAARGSVAAVCLYMQELDAIAHDPRNMDALLYAATYGHLDVVSVILDDGRTLVDHAGINGMTALMMASDAGHEAVVARLLAAGASVDLTDMFDTTALMYACDNGHEAVVAQLLAAGVIMDLTDYIGSWTALMHASIKGHEAVVARLLEAGASVGHIGFWGMTALSLACMNGHEAVIERLLEAREHEAELVK
jgi:hypothetical protein